VSDRASAATILASRGSRGEIDSKLNIALVVNKCGGKVTRDEAEWPMLASYLQMKRKCVACNTTVILE